MFSLAISLRVVIAAGQNSRPQNVPKCRLKPTGELGVTIVNHRFRKTKHSYDINKKEASNICSRKRIITYKARDDSSKLSKSIYNSTDTIVRGTVNSSLW